MLVASEEGASTLTVLSLTDHFPTLSKKRRSLLVLLMLSRDSSVGQLLYQPPTSKYRNPITGISNPGHEEHHDPVLMSYGVI